ncbi:hypothetical protein HMPREF9413_5396 [Paenibacillus sp. HGF7]|nr:hypothetical protein HMPREF9413_5396 [Paenibacillus sp. HGF7]
MGTEVNWNDKTSTIEIKNKQVRLLLKMEEMLIGISQKKNQ